MTHSLCSASNMYSGIFLAFCLCFLSLSSARMSCKGPQTVGELREVLWGADSSYDKRVRPNVAIMVKNNNNNNNNLTALSATPDIVRTQLHVLAVNELDVKTGEFKLMAWLREHWNDPRLAYSTEILGGCFPENKRQGFAEEDLKLIWKPDLVIHNLLDEKETASSFWIESNGDVIYVRSLLLTVACRMEFSKFPRDQQRCFLSLGSWLEDSSEVVLDVLDDTDPVTLAAERDFGGSVSSSSEWEVESTESNRIQNTIDDVLTSESVVHFTFNLKRNSKHYTDFVVGPVLIIVVLSWCSFFIARSAAPARVTMTIVCFLTNMNFLSSQLSTLPRLSNDVWILKFLTVSMLFTFYAVIEYVACNYLRRVEQRVKNGHKVAMDIEMSKRALFRMGDLEFMQGKSSKETMSDSSSSSSDVVVTKTEIVASGFDYKFDKMFMKSSGNMVFRDEHLDIFSRYMYPIIYAICFSILWANAQ